MQAEMNRVLLGNAMGKLLTLARLIVTRLASLRVFGSFLATLICPAATALVFAKYGMLV